MQALWKDYKEVTHVNQLKRIESFCHEHGLKIKSLRYVEENNDSSLELPHFDTSYYELCVYFTENRTETYDTTFGDTVEEGIEIMFKQIEDDMNNIQLILMR